MKPHTRVRRPLKCCKWVPGRVRRAKDNPRQQWCPVRFMNEIRCSMVKPVQRNTSLPAVARSIYVYYLGLISGPCRRCRSKPALSTILLGELGARSATTLLHCCSWGNKHLQMLFPWNSFTIARPEDRLLGSRLMTSRN